MKRGLYLVRANYARKGGEIIVPGYKIPTFRSSPVKKDKASGKWLLDFRVNGRRRRVIVDVKTKWEAEEILKGIERDFYRKTLNIFGKEPTKYWDFVEQFIKNHSRHSKSHLRDIKLVLKRNFGPFIEKKFGKDCTLFDITRGVFLEYRNHRLSTTSPGKKNPPGNETVNHDHRILKSFFNSAVNDNKLDKNPCVGIRMLPVGENEIIFLEKEEIPLFLDACSDEFRAIAVMAIYSGQRKSEIINSMWKDILFKRRVVKVTNKSMGASNPDVKCDWTTKSYRNREVPMCDELYHYMIYYKDKAVESPYVFPQGNGEKRSDDTKFLNDACKKASMKALGRAVNFHVLRHTFASHLVMEGVPLRTVQEYMGHQDIKTTMIYAHLANRHKVQQINKLNISLERYYSKGPGKEDVEDFAKKCVLSGKKEEEVGRNPAERGLFLVVSNEG